MLQALFGISMNSLDWLNWRFYVQVNCQDTKGQYMEN